MKKIKIGLSIIAAMAAIGCNSSLTDPTNSTNLSDSANTVRAPGEGKSIAVISDTYKSAYQWGWWGDISGTATSISGAGAVLWCIDGSGVVYQYTGSTWVARNLPSGKVGLDVGASTYGVYVTTTAYDIYRWNGSSWTRVEGLAKKIDIDNKGNLWYINSSGTVYQKTTSGWTARTGIIAQDIGVGNGVVYATATDQKIYKWSGNAWIQFSGAAVSIDVDPKGTPWCIDGSGNIYELTSGVGWVKRETFFTAFIGKDVAAVNPTIAYATGTDSHIHFWSDWGLYMFDFNSGLPSPVSISGTTKNVWYINSSGYVWEFYLFEWICHPLPSGKVGLDIGASTAGVYVTTTAYDIYQWNGSSWTLIGGLAKKIEVDNNGNLWCINPSGTVYERTTIGWTIRTGIIAQDIGVGNGVVYATATDKKIYKWSGIWTLIPGSAVRIDVDHNGNPWCVNESGIVYEYTIAAGWAAQKNTNYAGQPMSAVDITAIIP